MKVGIIGSGGREHAICAALKKSSKINKIFCFPGNAGTTLIAENVDLDTNDFQKLSEFIIENKIDIVIVGPEKPLVNGITDFLNKKIIKVFGPSMKASQLEGSKIFTKKMCEKYNIPTAKFGIFKNNNEAQKFLENCEYPIVVKADGLAAGKGVYICNNKNESFSAIKEIFEGKFGVADSVLIEEFLKGEEMSFFIISDGKNYKVFGTAQDHKRVFEGDKGKNTGGMGAYSPSRLESEELNKKILTKIIEPTLKGLQEINTTFQGFLYAGLMIINNEPYLIEYNVRMGDPECQTILPKLKTDLSDIVLACCEEKLSEVNIEWLNKKSLCIVVCSKGYPDKFDKNIEIKNIENIKLNSDEFLFHAGTLKKNNKIYAVGGRVFNLVCISNDFSQARNNIISNLKKLNWQGGFYREDIGYKVIE